MKDDAAKLAAILIRLRQEYPFFLKDVDPADPDLEQDTGFKLYEKLRQSHAD